MFFLDPISSFLCPSDDRRGARRPSIHDGPKRFDALRSAFARRTGSCVAFLYAFDLLELGLAAIFAESPWESHREALRRLLRRIDRRHPAERAHGRRWAAKAPYRSGRSPHWIKVKNPTAPAATRVME